MHTSIRLENSPIEILKLTPVNPLISKCEIKVCYVGDEPNRNRSIITKETARKMANSLPGSPIVGFYNENKGDFEEHSRELIIKDGKLIMKDITKPYGFVDLNAKVWFAKYLDDGQNEREYLVTEGYLWTGQYEEARRILDKGNNHSMELDEDTLDAHWAKKEKYNHKLFIINDAIISKLCTLGLDNEPCFEGSRITAPTIQFSLEDDYKKQLFSMRKELKDLLQEGESKMFTRCEVKVGEPLWNALYSHVEANYAEHTIESICEVESQKFAILTSGDKYFRVNFSVENEEYNFEEATEIDNYVPSENPQFSPEEVENYKNLGKTEKDNENKTDDESEDKTEKCSKCGKPVDECECSQGPVYVLEEIPEYVELQNRYSALETSYNTLKSEHDTMLEQYNTLQTNCTVLNNNFNELQNNYSALTQEKESLEQRLEPLAQFKKDYDKKEKQNMINSFYMLSNEDKKDVIENIDNYSLEEIESKLSVICVRNRVSFSTETPNNAKPAVSYSFNGDLDEDEAVPAWVKAAFGVAKTLN